MEINIIIHGEAKEENQNEIIKKCENLFLSLKEYKLLEDGFMAVKILKDKTEE